MPSRSLNAYDALRKLSAGNRRFVKRKPIHGQVNEEAFAAIRGTQRPLAVIVGCSDSRVPPELVFDQGFGDLFVIRLAGNVIAPGVAGSIQYAHRHLGTKLLVVLGHEGCGAVKAALAAKFHRAQHPGRIQQLVAMIEPGLEQIGLRQAATAQLSAAVEANVRWSLLQLNRTPEVQQAVREHREILIVGAVYDLATGKVRWLKS